MSFTDQLNELKRRLVQRLAGRATIFLSTPKLNTGVINIKALLARDKDVTFHIWNIKGQVTAKQVR